MKQIIPFKKELLFKTKVSEITSISLEHTLSLKEDDLISGEFHITGDYKMTEGSINREKFQFKLPFDIALDSRYDMDSIVIDIDNFYYEIVNNEYLQVNIDVYVEGEKIEESEKVVEMEAKEVSEEKKEEKEIVLEAKEEVVEEAVTEAKDEEVVSLVKEEDFADSRNVVDKVKDLFKEEYTPAIDVSVPKPVVLDVEKESNSKVEFNLFENIDNSDTYVTYHVYIVKEGDTLDKILDKYSVTKESVSHYNDLDNIIPGTKLIIPSSSNE